MSEPIVLALIACTQAVLVAAIGAVAVVLGKVRRDTAAVRVDANATREQVVNHHDTNFRDENDSRHAETRRWFTGLTSDLRAASRDIGGIRQDIRGVRSDLSALSQRVDHIEREEHP